MSYSPAAKWDWSEILPWTIIFRSLTTTFSVVIFLFAFAGTVATPVGWMVSEAIFIGSPEFQQSHPAVAELAAINGSPYRHVLPAPSGQAEWRRWTGFDVPGPRRVFDRLVRPFQIVVASDLSLKASLYFAVGGMWTVFVWSFAGLGVCRVALLKLTRNERASIGDAYEYCIGFFRACLSALAIPFAIALLLLIPLSFFNLLMNFQLGVAIAGFFWPVVLLLSLMLGTLLLGLMASWPLVVASVAAEGQNSFDAITRALAYVFQRPVHYFFYALIATAFGGVCWSIIGEFSETVIQLSFWSTQFSVSEVGDVESNVVAAGHQMIQFWTGFARTSAVAIVYGLFWCLASAVYLLLRRDVDHMEMDEIFLIDERRTYDLPPLKSDEHGIPQIQPLPSDE